MLSRNKTLALLQTNKLLTFFWASVFILILLGIGFLVVIEIILVL